MKIASSVCLTAIASCAICAIASGQAVVPGYLTDPTVMKERLPAHDGYKTPDEFKYPYISTYYVKPTVTTEEDVKIGVYITDFDASKIRLLDDSHIFTLRIEYRKKGDFASTKHLSKEGLKSGDTNVIIGKLPEGDYEIRVWAVDAAGRESHRVIHDFRVLAPADTVIPEEKIYRMTAADLAKYGIRNDGDLERIVHVSSNSTKVVKEKRAGVPGYTVTVPLDPETGKVPFRAFQKATVVYDEGYDKAAVEAASAATTAGIQKLLDEKAAAGFRKVVMLPGTYRITWTNSVFVPDRMTLDLGTAVLKQNGFTGANSAIVRLSSVYDAHLTGGTLEGDYWEHDYKGSPNNSEWPAGFEIGGDSWYCSVDGVKVVDITGYGGQNGICKDSRGGHAFIYERLPAFSKGSLNPRDGSVDENDEFRYTSDFKDIRKIKEEKKRSRFQISKYLGYQGRRTRSWQMTVAWYDADRNFIYAETAWQYREMWIPEKAAFLRVSIEEESLEAADKTDMVITAMRYPINCAVRNNRFEHCRCVGYAASAMKNMLFEGNFFTTSGESAAHCAFDAEDGWDQMQDVYFLGNVFRNNPRNNSILTCAGHNFILEKNDGDIHFWGRTHSPCVRGNKVGQGTYRCDSRLRSGYGRFYGNTYSQGFSLGATDDANKGDGWDYVISGMEFDGKDKPISIEIGKFGRAVNCTFRSNLVWLANVYGCVIEDCSDGTSHKAFPGGRWLGVTVRNSSFKRFFGESRFDSCKFTGTTMHTFKWGKFKAKNTEFTDCAMSGFSTASLAFEKCSFKDTTFAGGYWEPPADFSFTNCTFKLKSGAPFLKIGTYGIGKISFSGGEVSGENNLVYVSDLRPILRPPNADPETNPDKKPGEITVGGIKWNGEKGNVIDYTKGGRDLSPKQITVRDAGGNSLPPTAAFCDTLPATWRKE